MRFSWQFKYVMILFLCLTIFLLCSNIVVDQMNGIVGMELPMPFHLQLDPGQEIVTIGILNVEIALDQEYIKNTYSLAQQYIQNFASKVQYSLVPRVKYGADLFIKGINQLINDVDQIYNKIR